MCTIVVLSRAHAAYPLILAANRDEFYARETRGPSVLGRDPRAVGGVDVQEGGTWMGANANGLVAAVTNQRTHAPPDRGLRSRGHVVRTLLGASSTADARRLIEAIEPAQYNSFNLLFGDAGALFVAYVRREQHTLEIEAIPSGVSVLPNDRIGSPEFPKSERAASLAGEAASQPWPDLVDGLHRMLGDHELPPPERVPEPPPGSILPSAAVLPLQALCVHTPHYGTRSATIVALEPGRVAHYLYADGPPCETELEDFTALCEQRA